MGLNLEETLLISNVQVLLSQVAFYIITSPILWTSRPKGHGSHPTFLLPAGPCCSPCSHFLSLPHGDPLSLSLRRSTPAAAPQTSSLLVLSPLLPLPSHPAHYAGRRPRLPRTAPLLTLLCPHQASSLPRVGITLCAFQQHIGQDPRCSGHR